MKVYVKERIKLVKSLTIQRTLLCMLLITCVLSTNSQVTVESKINPMEIMIGEQADLTLSVTMKRGQLVEMPIFQPAQYITPGVEVVEAMPADTLKANDGLIEVKKVYKLTSFDEKLYYIPAIKVRVDAKEYETKNLALKVLDIPVDTLHPENFYPPKDVQDNPFQWSEWSGVFWCSILLILLLCVVFYLRVCMRENKPVMARVRIVKRLLPHQKAMREIEQIKADGMQTSGNQKEYYTRLTDTLRKYIEERFGFNAMEMTSSEIITHLQQAEDKTMIDELRELFTTADLVKFAKYSTLINENDANLVNAIQFINSTKQENQPTTERIEPKLTEQEKKSIQSRKTLRWGIIVLSVAGVLMLAYIVFQIYLLM